LPGHLVGVWHEQINNCIWSLPTLGFEGRKTFLLNNKSVGIIAAGSRISCNLPWLVEQLLAAPPKS
jgi:hypothetical protein